MAKVAAGHLYVTTRGGEVWHFAPGDALPSWAQKVIRNPAAITDDGRSASRDSDEPSKTWKVDDLKAYAAEQGVDLAGVSTKADILAALAAAEASADESVDEEVDEPALQDVASEAPAVEDDEEDDDLEPSPTFDPKA
ncbi:hypothetical protein [Brachybacterium kimchii]|uniref:Rho termination factor N-terminal domain-containing protein n=1 Tax=Brachybacterium kimchii TaxID=2942909 RepID=A0ABY4N7X4_9MICO|nr:hypothetical protein [Brachybacterium kimchii]UQN30660.1 hypothetical protein M4486_04985 [Brachybacterium kimchii]